MWQRDAKRRQVPRDEQLLYRAIGDAVRERRRQMIGSDGRIMSQAALASAIGRQGPFISQLESGKLRLHLDLVVRLAHALDVPASALLPPPIDPSGVR